MTEQITQLDITLASLSEICNDITVPRNVRTHIQSLILTLKQDTELSIKVNKALNGLDEISTDANLQPYTRTQIWNVMSLLEKL